MTGPSASTSKDFFDTNVLVYGYDRRDPAKRLRALALLAAAIENGTGAVSAQVLSEFFNVVTRRLPDPLSFEVAGAIIGEVASMSVVEIDAALVQRAIGACRRYQISYWDALIVAAAERARCGRILSEDLNAGQSYNGVVVVNPF